MKNRRPTHWKNYVEHQPGPQSAMKEKYMSIEQGNTLDTELERACVIQDAMTEVYEEFKILRRFTYGMVHYH